MWFTTLWKSLWGYSSVIFFVCLYMSLYRVVPYQFKICLDFLSASLSLGCRVGLIIRYGILKYFCQLRLRLFLYATRFEAGPLCLMPSYTGLLQLYLSAPIVLYENDYLFSALVTSVTEEYSSVWLPSIYPVLFNMFSTSHI